MKKEIEARVVSLCPLVNGTGYRVEEPKGCER